MSAVAICNTGLTIALILCKNAYLPALQGTIIPNDVGKEEIFMANLSEVELQHVRHLLQFGEADIEKFQNYAQNSQDENVKQFFEKSAKSCEKNRQTIMQFLK